MHKGCICIAVCTATQPAGSSRFAKLACFRGGKDLQLGPPERREPWRRSDRRDTYGFSQPGSDLPHARSVPRVALDAGSDHLADDR